MANVLSLALKITADATGLRLTPVERALKGLGDQADKLTAQFDQFSTGSGAAAAAQADFAKRSQELIDTLRSGGPEAAARFAAEFAKLADEARDVAAAFTEGQRVTEANRTAEERRAIAVNKLNDLLSKGAIDQETFNRAITAANSQLDKTATSASKADTNIESLTKNVRLLSVIEVGRLIVDGIQAISNVISSVVNNIASFVSGIANSFDQFNDLSARTGIGVEALQGYSLAAKLAGVDTAEFGSAVQKLAVTIGKATPGDNLDKSLRAINLSVAQLRGLAPEQQFSAIGDAISGLPTAAERAAAAVEIFGKQGAALAPLFREGAASIEELRERAERLGIIVDETQLNNIGAMNDAFDLARATVEGIAGQVIGNLAPAVTAVVDQFLEFIEAFEGAEGTGGTGIANAISTVLFDGAEFLAGVFDSFVTQFGGFSVTLQDAADVFAVVGNVLVGISETFRSVFNIFELAGNALLMGLGKVLEGLGSWVSSDLEQAGKDLQAAGFAAAQQNSRELESAATNAANAFTGALTGGAGSASSAGEGTASQFLQGVRQKFEQSQAPEFKIATNLDTTGERLTAFLEQAGDGADKFLLDSVATLDVFKEQAATGELTAAQIQIMTGFSEQLNGQLDAELAKRQEAVELAAKQSEAVDKIVAASLEQQRVDRDFGGDTGRAKAAEDLLKITEEIARVENELLAAVNATDTAAAESANARLETLRSVESALVDSADAVAQGFTGGFDKAFQATATSLDPLIEKASQFGNEGAIAAQELQRGVDELQERVRDGILGRSAYEAELAAQKELFDQRIANLDAIAAREQQQREAQFNAQVEANNRLQAVLNVQVPQRAAEAAGIQALERQKLAAENLIAIENQIALSRQTIEAAREQGNLRAAAANNNELKFLQDLAAQEKAIIDGKAVDRQQSRDFLAEQSRAAQAQQQAAERGRQKQEEQRKEQEAAQAEIEKARQEEFKRQTNRLRQLNSIGQQSVSSGDIRSSEGASAFVRAAAGQFDPVLAQLRVQSKILNTIALGLARNLSALTGTPTNLGAVRV